MQSINPNMLQAEIDDLPSILRLFEKVKKALNEKGLYQWPENYPSVDMFNAAVLQKAVWVLKKEGEIVGTYTLNSQQDESYTQIKWKHIKGKTLVLHRLAIHPDHQGHGLGRMLVLHAEEIARAQSANQMRLDTWSKNSGSVRLYSTLGFEQAKGFCYFHGHPEPFYCFEKKL